MIGPRFRVTLLLVVTIVTASYLFSQRLVLARPANQGTIRMLSIEQLTTKASAIFVAEVIEMKELPGKGLPVRQTTFRIKTSLLPEPKEGDKFSVKEFSPQATSVEAGELVLWYLGEKSDRDFRRPLGDDIGDFRRVSDPDDPDLLVKNFSENRGLWSNQAKLWNDTTFRRKKAGEYLSSYLQANYQELAKDSTALKHRVERTLALGDEPCQPRALPLEFVLAATHARLNSVH